MIDISLFCFKIQHSINGGDDGGLTNLYSTIE